MTSLDDPGKSASALYSGTIRHRRFVPIRHAFRYRLSMLLLDLDFADRELTLPPLIASGSRAIATFKRSDYVGENNCQSQGTVATGLKRHICNQVEEATGIEPDGKVLLLTHLRYWGFMMNPIAVFYCHDASGTLVAAALQVTNTPWRQKTLYILPAAQHGGNLAAEFEKQMHVSPFNHMDMRYLCRFRAPADKLFLHLENHVVDSAGRNRHTDATMLFERRELTRRRLVSIALRQPAFTVKVGLGIYWQALKLWLKGAPVYENPDSKQQQEYSVSARAPDHAIPPTSDVSHSTTAGRQ